MGFSRQEYWSGLPFSSPGDLPDPGIEPRSPALQADYCLSYRKTFLNIIICLLIYRASQIALVIKNLSVSAWDARHVDSIPGLERSPGVRNGNPLPYSCLENPMDRGAWWAVVHGAQRVRHNWETEQTHTGKLTPQNKPSSPTTPVYTNLYVKHGAGSYKQHLSVLH